MLLEEFLEPMELSQRDLADAIEIPYQCVDGIVTGRRGITPGIAGRLAHYFDMSSGFWLNLQLRWDVYYATRIEHA
jgi:antitoxin HigA-1